MKEVEIGCGGCNLNPAIKTRHIKPDGSIDERLLVLTKIKRVDLSVVDLVIYFVKH
jgi:hypothetical protein